MRNKLIATAMLVLLGGTVAFAGLATYGFTNITNNGSNNIAGSLFMTVSSVDGQPHQANFTFWMDPAQGSITEVYFDDGTLLGVDSVLNSTGTNFYQDGFLPHGNKFDGLVDPRNLPGGNAPGINFNVSTDYENPLLKKGYGFMSAEESGPTAWGVDQVDESLTICFDLTGINTYDDVINALGIGAGSGGLRAGIHVREIAVNGSDSFVNKLELIPAPGAVVLGAIGLSLTAWAKRRIT